MLPSELEARTLERASSTKAASELVERVIVAVKAEKVISKIPLAWALSHVVHTGDRITLLAVLLAEKRGRKLWNFSRLAGDCASSHRDLLPERIGQISESCSQMVLQLHEELEVRVRVKVVLGDASASGAVAAEAKNKGATWVVLDKKLKQELKHCMDELQCNIVVMKGSQPKVLRLNLGCLDEPPTPFFSASSSPMADVGKLQGHSIKHSTPVSSPEEPSTYSTITAREGSPFSCDTVASSYLVYENNPLFEGLNNRSVSVISEHIGFDNSPAVGKEDGERLVTLSKPPICSSASNHGSVLWIPQNHVAGEKPSITSNNRSRNIMRPSSSRTLLDRFVQYDEDVKGSRLGPLQTDKKDYFINSNIRSTVSLGRTSSAPPPLCSLCQHKAPAFGKPPRHFSYEQLEEATDGFSSINLLEEGRFDVVHRGVLRDGQVVAVKQLNFVGSQGDTAFCREVRVLSCAQHRNVVLLIGFCIEDNKRVLVYEYICNGSLDFHLHGNKTAPLDWHSRLKIAIGAARGLRYLHEDCRVGCIVHRELRPNNILLTHDFEPLVGDFGLARWHMSSEEKVIGTSGYLAPEYWGSGNITQKVDVYAFGVVLLELITGRRINEVLLFEDQPDWFHPVAALESSHILGKHYQILDPHLAHNQLPGFARQLQVVGRAASLCLHCDPDCRPPMSKVLRILEGGDSSIPLHLDINSIGNRSGHLRGMASSQAQPEARRSHSRTLSH